METDIIYIIRQQKQQTDSEIEAELNEMLKEQVEEVYQNVQKCQKTSKMQ